MEHGLSSNDVHCVMQDHTGMYWIGTANGLNVYDGHTVKVMHHDPGNKKSIPHDQVRSIVQDNNGYLWLGTDGGVARMNLRTRLCENFTNDEDDGDRPGNYKNVLEYHDDLLFLQSHTALWRFNHDTQKFVSQKDCSNSSIYAYDVKGSLLVSGTLGRITVTDLSAGSCDDYAFQGREEIMVTTISFSHDTSLVWIGTWEAGLWKLDLQTKTLEQVLQMPPITQNQVVYDVYEIQEDAIRLVYVAAACGVVRLKDEGGVISEVILCGHDATNPFSVSGSCVQIFRVNTNETWFASEQGFNVLRRSNQALQRVPDVEGNTTSYLNERYGPDNYEWYTSWYGKGIYVRHGNLDHFTALNPNPASSDANWTQTSGIARAGDGSLWVATFAGLVHATYIRDQWHVLEVLEGVNAMSICIDQQENIWVATYHDGLWIHDGTFRKWTGVGSENIPDLCWKVITLHDGRTVASLNSGIFIYDPEDRKSTVIRNVQTQHGLTALGTVFDTFEDSGHILWLSTPNGLFEFTDARHCKHYTTSDGLSDMNISAACEDAHHHLWVMCETGLCESTTGLPKKFTAKKDLPFYAPSNTIRWQDKGGNKRLIIGNRAHPLSLDIQALSAAETNTAIHIFEITADTMIVMAAYAPTDSTYRFTYKQNDLRFSFAAPVLFSSQRIQYMYQMIGADEFPISSAQRNYASYTNLRPGAYTFRVWVEGIEQQADAFRFEVLPPYWRTWWFILSCCSVGIVLIITAVKYISTKNLREKILILEKQQVLEKERSRISRDMHDELGSGLTKISILSEVAKSAMQQGSSADDHLASISSTSREMVGGLQEIIWALQPQNDNLQNLAAYIRENASRFFEHSSITLHVNFPEHIPAIHLSDEVKRSIYLIIKEALNNVMKHAQAENVSLLLNLEETVFVFEVQDDGKGFDKNKIGDFSNGLSNMNARALHIGGMLEITTGDGFGTRLTLRIGNHNKIAS